MNEESHSIERCLFPINPNGLQISHPVIGSIMQSHEDFHVDFHKDDPTVSIIQPLLVPSENPSYMEDTRVIFKMQRQFDARLAIESILNDNAKKISLVIPRDLLASDALSFFDIRLSKSNPNPIAKHLIDTFEILLYLLGDGISESWRGKLNGDVDEKADKDYQAAVKEYQRIAAKNTIIRNRNIAKQNKYMDEMAKWARKYMDGIKKSAKRKRKSKNQEDSEEEEEDDEFMGDAQHESTKPPAPIAESELEIPPVPQKPHFSPEELSNLYADCQLKITGGPEEKEFKVQNEHGTVFSFPRVHMDIEHVFNPSSNDTPQYDCLFGSDPVAYVIHFMVFDPRISILKGITRIIDRNVMYYSERNRRARIKDDNIRIQKNKTVGGTDDDFIYERREHSSVEALRDWEDWKRHLSVTCGMWKSFKLETQTLSMEDAKKTENSYLDPFFILNPIRMFNYYGHESAFDFNMLVADQELSTLERASWNLNMSNDFNFAYAYTQNKTATPWFMLITPNDVDFYDCHFYQNPYAVVRILCEDLHHICTLDSILPNLFRGVNKSHFYQDAQKGIPFPPLSNADTVSITDNNRILAERIQKGNSVKDNDLFDTICERLSGFYYNCNNEIRPEHKYTSLKIIKDDIFSKAFRGLASHSPRLPRRTKDVVRFHDNITGIGRNTGGIFPDIEKEIAGKSYITSTNKTCQFYELWNREYIEGPNLSQVHTHSVFMFIFNMIPLQFLRTPTQTMIVLFGPPGTGKTFVMNPFDRYLIPDTFQPVDSFSAMSFNTGGNRDGGISYTDDAGKEDPLFKSDAFGKRNNGVDHCAQLKTMLTKGYLSRSVTDMSNGRTSAVVLTSLKYLHVKLTNYQVKGNCEPAILDRCFTFYVPSTRRLGGVAQVQQQYRNLTQSYIERNGRICSTIFTRFQIFSCYMGYFLGCNALTWTPMNYMWGFSIYWKQFLDTYYKIHGHKLHVSSRFGDDRLKSIVYSCVIMRIWVEQQPTVGVEVEYDRAFNFEVFREIDDRHDLLVIQEDFIHALSYTEDVLPTRAFTHIIRWMLKYMKEIGYDPHRSILEGPVYWKENPKFFYNAAIGMTSGFGGGDTPIDVNYLEFNISGANKKEVIELMAKAIERNYNRFYFDLNEIISQIYCMINGDSTEGASIERHYYQPFVMQDGVLSAKPHLTHEAIKIEKRGETFHLYILRAWLDDWVKDPRSFFNNPLYNPAERFMSSPVYCTLKYMFNFKGARSGVFALPGMNLSKIAETDEREDEIRPFELMKISVENELQNEFIEIGEELKTRFPSNCIELPDENGHYKVYFNPTDECPTLDSLSYKRALKTQ